RSRLSPHVEGHDTPAQEAPTDVGEARAAHGGGEVFGAGEPAHAGREVRVRRAARQDPARERDEGVEPDTEERPQDARRPRELKAAEPASRDEHAGELTEPPFEVTEVADAEADCGDVEAGLGEGKLGGVPLHPVELRRLPLRPGQHLRGEIYARDTPAGTRVGER